MNDPSFKQKLSSFVITENSSFFVDQKILQMKKLEEENKLLKQENERIKRELEEREKIQKKEVIPERQKAL